MNDIIFCTLPPVDLDQIYSAPPLLKGIVQAEGFKAQTHDFGMDLYKMCDKNIEKFLQIQHSFSINSKVLSDENIDLLDRWYDHIINTLINSNSRYFGFSVFSVFTHTVTIEILKRLKELGLTDRVVLGGRGLKTAISRVAVNHLTNTVTANDRIQWFGDVLKRHELAVHVIQGDGENAIVEFLRNNADNHTVHFAKGFNFPHPDYSDYNLDDYRWNGGIRSLQVIGSKGCVRDCDFCDIKVQFGKYQFKDGLQLAEEMIYLQKQHNINKFVLVDSLSNGSMKHLMQFIRRMSEYNATAPIPIKWTGQYICKEYTPGAKTDEYYRLLKASGAEGLTIGAESGSNHVLASINKKTTVEALYAELENFRKHDITCLLLMFAGHWSETLDDFKEHCQMLIRLVPYIKNGTISGIQLGSTFTIYHDTPAWHNESIIRDKIHFENLWISTLNRGNTFKSRVKRRVIIELLSNALKLPSYDNALIMLGFARYIDNHVDLINNFFTTHGTDEGNIDDVMKYVEELLTTPEDLDININLTVSSTDTDPSISIRINNTELFNNFLKEGNHTLTFNIPYDLLKDENLISITMTNKLLNDTVVENGNIVKDKYIKINEFIINNSHLHKDVGFYYSNFYHCRDGVKEDTVTNGLWFNNQSLNLKIGKHFTPWYAETSNNNTSDWLKKQQTNGFNKELSDIFAELKLTLQKLVV